MPHTLAVENIDKSYDGRTKVLRDLSFTATPGEFIALVGPSGCGKSTVLRTVAGLEPVQKGKVSIGGRDVTHLDPGKRRVAMVFQDYALYPHKNVYENMAFGLRMSRTERPEIDRRVRQAAERMNLSDFLHRRPADLSGGQRQRVAIGRALVRNPDVFLFDEPLSNLDAALRVRMRHTIARLHQELGTTALYVTHDQVEAMTLADRIVVLRDGIVQQMGSPMNLYHHPDNVFVAAFMGSPAINLLNGRLLPRHGRPYFVSEEGVSISLGDRGLPLPEEGTELIWGVRHNNLKLEQQSPDDVSFRVKVLLTEPLGSECHVLVDLEGHELRLRLPEPHRPTRGEVLQLWFHSRHFYLFDKDSGLAIRPERKTKG